MENFRLWISEIVVAVIIVTVIELILPNSSSKKYIKIVLSIFVMYVIIVPIVDMKEYVSSENFADNEIDILGMENIEVSNFAYESDRKNNNESDTCNQSNIYQYGNDTNECYTNNNQNINNSNFYNRRVI